MEYRSINKIYYYMETVSLKKKKKGGVIRLNIGQYTCLEVFAKAKTKGGNIRVVSGKTHVMEKEARTSYYTWLKFPVEQDTEYELECGCCDVTLCYLSGNDKILETGVQYLEKEKQSGRYLPVKKEIHYNSSIREAYHFAPWKNWMNDPNGLCYFQGYYHMFYQFNPHGQKWSNMYWGHAASKDLIHWVHLPVVLAPQEEILEEPEKFSGGAFSGSAAVTRDGAVFYFTRHLEPHGDCMKQVEQQWMMKSRDMLHFTEEKCIIRKRPERASSDFRDPKVVKIGGRWYMVLGSAIEGKGVILLYESEDMEHWNYLHPLLTEETEGIRCFECPDFMELDGKYAAVGAWMRHYDDCGRFQMSRYYIGNWKEQKLEAESSGWFDFGSNCYAMQSFEHGGRRICIGWISDFYGEHVEKENGAYGSMTLPRQLHIRNNKLYMKPIEEVALLKGKSLYRGRGENIALRAIEGNAYMAEIHFSADTFFSILLGKDGEKEISLCNDESGLRIVTKGVKSQGICFRADVEKVTGLEIYMDGRVTEIYVNEGEAAGTKLFYNSSKDGCFVLQAENPENIVRAEVTLMDSIW